MFSRLFFLFLHPDILPFILRVVLGGPSLLSSLSLLSLSPSLSQPHGLWLVHLPGRHCPHPLIFIPAHPPHCPAWLEDVGVLPTLPAWTHGHSVPLAGPVAQAEQEPSAPSCPQPARAVQHVSGKTSTGPAQLLLKAPATAQPTCHPGQCRCHQGLHSQARRL